VIPPPAVALDTVASAATAAGTLALAFVTYKMVRKTADVAETGKLAAQAAAVEADATRRLVELERDQMRDARLPIVMPIASVGVGDTQNGEVVMTMPVENIGVGPAIGLRLRLEFRDQNGDPSVAPQPMQMQQGARAGLGVGQRADLRLVYRGLAIGPLLPFRIELTFADTFGNQFRVVGLSIPEESRYEGLELQALDKAGMPVATIAA
jgi:hypothetical protein